MTSRNRAAAPLGRFLGVVAALFVLAGCGGSGGGNVVITQSGSSGSNVATVEVDLGPNGDYVNGLFTSVEVCVPGTSTCVTVPNVLVDTGSSGLRLLSDTVPGLALPSVTESGSPLQECLQFVDLSYVWGPVVQADIHIANETASKASIQIISASPAYTVPSSCLTLGSSGATDNNTVQALGANGILGVGNFAQDCGSACSSAADAFPNYYVCPSAACEIASVPLADQLSNPVALFTQDNNGVLISLPSVPLGGAATATGWMIFGVGTQSNNALGNAQIYAVDASDDFTTTYKGVPYGNSYIDSGSNITYFLDSATLGYIECTDYQGFYCPASDLPIQVTNTGANGATGQVNFTIRNADSLFSSGNAAFDDLGGDSGTGASSDYFDFGIPFFFGRSVFVGIEGRTVPNGVSAPYGYWAY